MGTQNCLAYPNILYFLSERIQPLKETRRRSFRSQHHHKNAANLVQKVGEKALIVFLLHRLNDFEAVTCRLSADKAEKMSRIVFQCI